VTTFEIQIKHSSKFFSSIMLWTDNHLEFLILLLKADIAESLQQTADLISHSQCLFASLPHDLLFALYSNS